MVLEIRLNVIEGSKRAPMVESSTLIRYDNKKDAAWNQDTLPHRQRLQRVREVFQRMRSKHKVIRLARNHRKVTRLCYELASELRPEFLVAPNSSPDRLGREVAIINSSTAIVDRDQSVLRKDWTRTTNFQPALTCQKALHLRVPPARAAGDSPYRTTRDTLQRPVIVQPILYPHS